MERVLKVFCSGSKQRAVAKVHRVLERYDAFVLVEAGPQQAKQLASEYPVEDITDLYAIPLTERQVDASAARAAKPRPAAAKTAKTKPLAAGPHHYLVQFIGPIKRSWLKAVERAGGKVRAPFKDFISVVRADKAVLEKISALPFIRWVGHLPHDRRIAPSVAESLGRASDDAAAALPRTRVLPGVYKVEFFGPEDLQRAADKVKQLGFKELDREASGRVLVVEARGSAAQRSKAIAELAAVHGVRRIRRRALKRTSNDVAAGIMQAGGSTGNSGLGLSGKGEKVAVCDSGLDTGSAATVHQDFTGRVLAIKSYAMTSDLGPFVHNPGANDGPADVSDGHGTHVAGSVLGDGSASAGIPGLAGPIRGLAYEAKLIFQAVEQEVDWKDPDDLEEYGRFVLAGLPNDLTPLFTYAYDKGARIHSNSWGGGEPGEYDEQCEQLDRFVWKHKTFCVLVAAGNDGTDSDGDGKINAMSVTSPGTAKNCITVGACENKRTKFNDETYGGWWPDDYPASPFRNDPMANNPDQVVAFSSRGPTADGRTKPEVVAPGTFILSTRSTMIAANNFAWAKFTPSKMYFHMGGTSMATPLTAGAVALVREYLRKKRKIKSPRAALLKAALIAGATRLSGTAAASAILDNQQGFGRVNVDAVLKPSSPLVARFIEKKPGLSTGKSSTQKLNVKGGGSPLKVVMAYTDYPGPSLVNNLNLFVTAPDGTRFVGNNGTPGGTALDTDNNVEVVHVKSAAAGTWTVEIVGSNVPMGPQDFALVSIGRF